MPKKRPRGRPSKLTLLAQERLLALTRHGAMRQAACNYAGIHPETLRKWLRRGETETAGPFFEFARAFIQAEAAACLKAMATIRTAIEQNWQAAAWFLERKRPKEWGRRHRVEHTGPGGAAIRAQVPLADLARKQRRARLDAIARRLGVDPLPQNTASGGPGRSSRRTARSNSARADP